MGVRNSRFLLVIFVLTNGRHNAPLQSFTAMNFRKTEHVTRRVTMHKLTLLFILSILVNSYGQTGQFSILLQDEYSKQTISDGTVTFTDLSLTNLSLTKHSDSLGVCRFEKIETGIHSAMAYAPGYDTLYIPTVQVKGGKNRIFTLNLKKSNTVTLDSINVVGSGINSSLTEQPASVTRISSYELNNTPGSVNDINRVVSNLPSALSGLGGGVDNTLNIRGGHSRESIYLLDGIEFDNISHYSDMASSGGIVGFVNTSLVEHLDFYAGAFTADQPSALSSVMDIRLRSGSFLERKYEIDLNFSGLGVSAEGPFMNKRASYLSSFRIVNLFFLKSFLEDDLKVMYGDGITKFTFLLNDNNTLTAHGIYSFDRTEDPEQDWNRSYIYDENLTQAAGNLTWEFQKDKVTNRVQLNHLYRFNNDYNIHVSGGEYSFSNNWSMIDREDSIPQVGDSITYVTSLQDDEIYYKDIDKRNSTTLQNNFTLNLREQDQLKFGASGRLSKLTLEQTGYNEERTAVLSVITDLDPLKDSVILDTTFSQHRGYKRDTSLTHYQGGCYGEYTLRQGRLNASAGIRADYYSLTRDHGFSPRASLLFDLGKAGSISAGGGLYYQLPTVINEALLMLTPNKNSYKPIVGMPAYENIELQRNYQATLGYRKEIGTSHIISAEAYYKYYDREYELETPGRYQFMNGLDSALSQGNSYRIPTPSGIKKSYGFELFFQKKIYDKFYYSAGYALMDIKNRYAGGHWYRDELNVKHSLVGIVGSNFLKHHGISFKAKFRSGLPYSKTVFNDTDMNWSYDSSKDYLSEELDPVFTLDFRYSFRIYRDWGNIMGYVDLMNITGATPVIQKTFNSWMGYNETRSNGFLPVAGVTVDF